MALPFQENVVVILVYTHCYKSDIESDVEECKELSMIRKNVTQVNLYNLFTVH